jgi:hypothetical protein
LPSAAFYGALLCGELARGVLGDEAARAAARGLVRPRSRPPELASSDRLLAR